MRTIETNTRIVIKKAIEQYPLCSKNLLSNGEDLEGVISTFAHLTGLTPLFIKQNLQQIRNWI